MNKTYKNNEELKISISYTTNFKPADFLHFNNLKIFKKKNNNKIISRNFFLFLILLKYTKNNIYNTHTSIFVKPNYKKFITLLRAPYRYKLSRHQFVLSRYYVLLTILNKIEKIHFNSINDLIFLIKFFKKFYI